MTALPSPARGEPAAARPVPAVSARGLGRRYGRLWALAHVDLVVQPGQGLLVAGANGSGKTTLLRLLAGLERPTRGELSLFGRRLAADRVAWRREVSLVSHQSFLYDRLSAAETVRLWSRLLGRPASRPAVETVLARVGLADAADRPAGKLSAGMQKRLSLARVALEEPRLVLLDEPFAALDPAGQRWIERWIGELRDAGRTVVLASHALERAGAVCDRALVLRRGQVAWQGAAEAADGRFARLEAP